MPRIPPRGPGAPPGPTSAEQTEGAKEADKTQAASLFGTDSARDLKAKNERGQALLRQTKAIAKRFKDGELSQKEATREFVALVIEERFPKKRKKKRDQDGEDGHDEMEEAVTEAIDEDPSMAERLRRQFERLIAEDE